MRIPPMLESVDVASARDYLRLAAANIRRVLLDLARHYDGPRGLGANHASPPPERAAETPSDAATEPFGAPLQLAAWTEFHERVATLPEDECETFGLL